MKGNKATYRTIEELADNMCLDLGEGSHRKEQYLRWLLAEAETWKTDMAKEVKTVKLELTAWKAIELPSDCIRWIKLGIQDGNVIKTFVNRNDIAIIHDLNGNGIKINNEEPESYPDLTVDQTLVYPFFNYHEGKLFGLGVKDNGFGYFTENRNENSNEIQFRTKVDSGSDIYLEYLANGWNPNEQTLVHPFAAELCIAGAHYRRLKFDKINSKKVPADDVERARRDYLIEYDRLIDRMWDYSIEDIIEITNDAQMLTANPVH
jgi:hypothetical protein